MSLLMYCTNKDSFLEKDSFFAENPLKDPGPQNFSYYFSTLEVKDEITNSTQPLDSLYCQVSGGSFHISLEKQQRIQIFLSVQLPFIYIVVKTAMKRAYFKQRAVLVFNKRNVTRKFKTSTQLWQILNQSKLWPIKEKENMQVLLKWPNLIPYSKL